MAKKNNKAQLKAAKRRVVRKQKTDKKNLAKKQSQLAEAKQVQVDAKKILSALLIEISNHIIDQLSPEARSKINANIKADIESIILSEGFTKDDGGVYFNGDISTIAYGMNRSILESRGSNEAGEAH